jgi:hypothetical protein
MTFSGKGIYQQVIILTHPVCKILRAGKVVPEAVDIKWQLPGKGAGSVMLCPGAFTDIHVEVCFHCILLGAGLVYIRAICFSDWNCNCIYNYIMRCIAVKAEFIYGVRI